MATLELLFIFMCLTHNVLTAHAKAVKSYKEMKQFGEIGITHVFSPAFSIDNKEENINKKVFSSFVIN